MKKYKFLIFELYEESIVKYANKRAKSVEKSLLFIINNNSYKEKSQDNLTHQTYVGITRIQVYNYYLCYILFFYTIIQRSCI